MVVAVSPCVARANQDTLQAFHGIRALDPSAPRHVSARITRRWPRLRCGRVSPIRFSLTGAAPSSRAPADRPRRRAAKRKTLFHSVSPTQLGRLDHLHPSPALSAVTTKRALLQPTPLAGRTPNRSPRPHVRAAHDEFGHPRTAVAAAPFHLHQRHVAVAGGDQRGEIRVLGVVGRFAIRAPALHCRTQAGEAYGSQTLLRGPQQRVGTRSSRSISASPTQSLAFSSDTSIPACCSMVVPSMMLEQASA